MGKRKKYTPKNFESSKPKDISCNLYASMLQSPAYMGLTTRQKVLYQYMKLQLYGAKQIEGQPVEAFYFNAGMAVGKNSTYNLYSKRDSFYGDIKQLVAAGFIEVAECGRFTRTKNVYVLSSKWAN